MLSCLVPCAVRIANPWKEQNRCNIESKNKEIYKIMLPTFLHFSATSLYVETTRGVEVQEKNEKCCKIWMPDNKISSATKRQDVKFAEIASRMKRCDCNIAAGNFFSSEINSSCVSIFTTLKIYCCTFCKHDILTHSHCILSDFLLFSNLYVIYNPHVTKHRI